MCFHRPNLISCEVIDSKQNPLIREYPPLYNLEHLLELAVALKHFWDQNIIVLGDLFQPQMG